MVTGMKKIVFLLLTVMGLSLYGDNEFVIKKEKKKHASSAQKEDTGRKAGSTTRGISDIHRKGGRVQGQLLDSLEGLIQGDKKSTFCVANRQQHEQIQSCCERIDKKHEELLAEYKKLSTLLTID